MRVYIVRNDYDIVCIGTTPDTFIGALQSHIQFGKKGDYFTFLIEEMEPDEYTMLIKNMEFRDKQRQERNKKYEDAVVKQQKRFYEEGRLERKFQVIRGGLDV